MKHHSVNGSHSFVSTSLSPVAVAILAALFSSATLATQIKDNQEMFVDTQWNDTSTSVGYVTDGRLIITAGGELSTNLLSIGRGGSTGIVDVIEGGTLLVNTTASYSYPFDIGGSGNGATGATTTSGTGFLNISGEGSTVTFSQSGSYNSASLQIGASSGQGYVSITNGGKLLSTSENEGIWLGARKEGNNTESARGTVLVDGTGSELRSGHRIIVGTYGEGFLTTSGGGLTRAENNISVGNQSSALLFDSILKVTGENSVVSAGQSIIAGLSGKGTVVASDSGTLQAQRISVASNTGSSGELAVGSRLGETAAAAGVIDTSQIVFGAGNGELVLNHTSDDFTLDADISGKGVMQVVAGTSVLTGDNSAFQGQISVNSFDPNNPDDPYSPGSPSFPATLVISEQKNIGTNDVDIIHGTLAIETAQDWRFINTLNGNGTLSVDTAGNWFDFSSSSLTDNFSGILSLKDTLFSLTGTNTDALKNTLLKLGSDSVATVGDGQQTINGLAFDGGTLVMGSVTPGQTTTENTVHTIGQLDISGSGTVQLTTPFTVIDHSPVPDGTVPLLAQDDGNILVQLVSTDGSVTGRGGNLILTDHDGNIISDGGVTTHISQNGNIVAQGTWDYRLTGGDNNDGLWINYGLTQVELLGPGSEALILNSEGRTGSAADLSARLTGSGDLAIDTGTGNTVSLSNLENDYTGATELRSGTLLMQNDSVLGATSLLQMAQGTALEMNGHSQTVGSVGIEDDAQVNLDGGHLEITQGGSIAGELTGNGSLALTGGILTVDGANRTLNASVTVEQDATADLNNVQGLGGGAMALAGRVNLNGAEGVFMNSLSGSGTLALSASQIQLAGDNTTFSGIFGVDADSRLTVTSANQPGEAAVENAGRLVLSADEDWQINNRITGAGSLEKYGSGRVTLDEESVAYTGATDIYGGALVFGDSGNAVTLASSQVTVHDAGLLAGNGVIAGNVNNQGVLQVGVPDTEATTQTAAMNSLVAATQASLTINGDLVNSGLVRISGTDPDSQPGNRLIVNGDYTGDNGHLAFSSVLGDDASLTDHMTVNGDTSGTTHVSVRNAGGNGAQTLEGIELIRVGGHSDGEFVQDGRIVAGAYDYTLIRGKGDAAGNWHLTSWSDSIITEPSDPTEPAEPGEIPGGAVSGVQQYRPEAGSYLVNSRAANTLFMTRLDDRPGETRYTDALTGEQNITSLWLRNAGGHTRSRDDSGQLKTQANRYVMQLGGDLAQWSTNDTDRWRLGVMGGYARSQSRTVSDLTGYRSHGQVSGYSAGLYGTWYANDADKTGLYVDTWALYNWFDNRVSGQEQATEKYKSFGVTASVETGYSMKLGERGRNSYWLQPQAQVVWMDVQADDHREKNGTRVTDDGRGNLQTRLGMKAYISGHHAIDDGKDREFRPFVEANWLHNTRDTRVRMDDVSNNLSGTKNAGEVKLGVEGQITPRLAVWGNVAQQVGDNGYSDTQGGLGIRYSW